MPVHPCGNYRIHSVTGLLETMYSMRGLKMCHRLDRTTSGVLVLAKNDIAALFYQEQARKNLIVKEYVCKVIYSYHMTARLGPRL